MIRTALKSDLGQLCRLYLEFHEFHVRGVPNYWQTLGDPDTYNCTQVINQLEALLEDKNAALFVAEGNDNQLVGLAEVYLRHDEPNPARLGHTYGYLQSLMVAATARNQRIGTQLVEVAEQWARTHGATEFRA